MALTAKTHKARKVTSGTSKSGYPYTIVNFSCSRKDSNAMNGFKNEFYNLFVMAELDIATGDEFKIHAIKDVEKKTSDYNGKSFFDVTIFAEKDEIEIIPQDGVVDVFNDDLPF